MRSFIAATSCIVPFLLAGLPYTSASPTPYLQTRQSSRGFTLNCGDNTAACSEAKFYCTGTVLTASYTGPPTSDPNPEVLDPAMCKTSCSCVPDRPVAPPTLPMDDRKETPSSGGVLGCSGNTPKCSAAGYYCSDVALRALDGSYPHAFNVDHSVPRDPSTIESICSDSCSCARESLTEPNTKPVGPVKQVPQPESLKSEDQRRPTPPAEIAATCMDTTLAGYAVTNETLPKGANSEDMKVYDYCTSTTVNMKCNPEEGKPKSPTPKVEGTDEANICRTLCTCPV